MSSIDDRLARLEKSTAKLLTVVAELRAENTGLRRQLSAGGEDASLIRKEVTTLREERQTIRKRLQAMNHVLDKALATESPQRTGKRGPTSTKDEAKQPVVEELTLF